MNAEKMAVKQRIIDDTLQAKARNEAAIAALKDSVSLDAYAHLVRESEHGRVWTDALAAAVKEHEIVVIPESDEVYWIDKTVFIPSNTHIEATGAKIRLVPEYPYVMLTNEHVHDGTYAPIDTSDRDVNISIHGGSWEECSKKRGERKFHADKSSFFGVQALMLFGNITHITMTDVTFVSTMGFSVQVGDITDGVFENFFVFNFLISNGVFNEIVYAVAFFTL